MGSRWLFTDEGSAVQVSQITELKVGKSGTSDCPYSVMAHVVGPRIVTITCYSTRTEAEEAIHDMVVGREHKRS